MIAPSLRTTISVSAARRSTLTRCGGCSGMRPGALQISTERHQLLVLRPAERRRTTRNQGGDLSFDLCDSLQCLVPAALQLAGDQPVCRVDGVVLSARVRGFEARLLLRQLQLALGRSRRARLRLDRSERCPMPSGFRTRRTSLLIAASMLKPLIEMQRAAPWFVRAQSQISTPSLGPRVFPELRQAGLSPSRGGERIHTLLRRCRAKPCR